MTADAAALVARLAPFEHDPDTAGFWAAAREHRLVVRACNRCGAVLHMPRAHCGACDSWDTGWRDSAGRGTVHSWTVVTHTIHPAYPAPYTVVLVDVDDAPGARLAGFLPGEPALRLGQPMEVWFDTLDDGAVLPQWRAVGPDSRQETNP